MQKNKKLILSLKNIHSELGSFYESALQILQNKNIPNKLQAAAYCIRELLTRLPNHFDSSLLKTNKKISTEFKPLIELWENLNIKNFLNILPQSGNWEPEQISSIKIFLDRFNQLVINDKEIKATRREHAAQFIKRQNEQYSSEHLPDSHIDYLGKAFYVFSEYFNKVLHSPCSDTDEGAFRIKLGELELYLIGLIEPNVKKTYDKIDKIILKEGESPNIDSIKNVLSLIHNKVSYDYFFDCLKSSHWLKPLKDAGVFISPPNIIQHNELIQTPSWGPSRYLVNIAEESPKEVSQIILTIPDTNNLKIYQDYVNAALKMPLDYAKTIVKKVIRFLNNPFCFYFANNLSEFAVFFLKNNCSQKALEIYSRLFDIEDSGDNYGRYKHFFTNDWEYNEKLNLIYSNMKTPEEKLDLFRLICIQLKKCIEFDCFNKNSFVDHSSSWRQEISKSNNHDDIKNTLTNWVVKLSEELFLSHEEEIVDLLITESFPIFTRVALHLLQDKLESNDFILDLLQKEKYYASLDMWHEYALLLQKAFPSWEQKKQESFLYFVSQIQTYEKKEQNEVIKYRIYYLIKDYLHGEIKNKFEFMRQKYGDIKEPTFLIYLYSESVSLEALIPITQEEFDEKNIEERLRYLLNWEPKEKHTRYDDKAGLYHLLKNSIKSLSNEYIEHIDLLKIEEEQFIIAVIYGFEDSLLENLMHWKSLINYLKWAINNNSSKKNVKLTEIRMAACRLLNKGLSSNNIGIDFSLKNDLWFVINHCLKDSDPLLSSEKTIQTDDSDFYHKAINSVRSKALECSILYGLWCLKNLGIPKGEGKKELLPELFQTLEYFLNYKNEQSLAVHSIYGRWLPWLYLLDKHWTCDNLSKILPHTQNNLNRYNSAWHTYLLYIQPYDEMFNYIEKEYDYAVNQLSSDSTDKTSIRLVNELIVFYLRGTIESLESEIFNNLYKKNNIELFKEIISFTGRFSTEYCEEKAISIWEKTLLKCEELDQYVPLTEFGYWTALDFLNDEWILDQIIIVLSKAKYIHPEHFIIDRLCKAYKKHSLKVTEVLNLIVSNKLIHSGFNMWSSGFETLIPELLTTESIIETKSLINKLLLLGLKQFEKFIQ